MAWGAPCEMKMDLQQNPGHSAAPQDQFTDLLAESLSELETPALRGVEDKLRWGDRGLKEASGLSVELHMRRIFIKEQANVLSKQFEVSNVPEFAHISEEQTKGGFRWQLFCAYMNPLIKYAVYFCSSPVNTAAA